MKFSNKSFNYYIGKIVYNVKEYDFNSNSKVLNLDNITNLVETKVIEILKNKDILDLIQSNQQLTISEKNRQLEENLDYVDIDKE